MLTLSTFRAAMPLHADAAAFSLIFMRCMLLLRHAIATLPCYAAAFAAPARRALL